MTSTLAPNYASKNYSFYYAGKLGFFMYVMLVKKTSRAEAKNLFARVNGRWSNSERLTNTYELKKNIDKFTANFSAQALLCKPNAHYQIEKDISLQAHCMCLKRFTEAFCEVEDCFLIDLKRSELGKLVKCYVNTMFNRMGDQAEGLLLQIEQLLLAKFSDDLKLLMETLIKHLLALIEKGAQPEIGFIQQKASKLRAFATAEGYGNIIESLFEHERNLENDGNSVLNWRLNKCNCGTRPLMSLINQQVTNILQTANPVMQEIEGRKPASTVMEILFEDFYAGKSMIEISDELVNEYGLHSPFDWLVLDIAGTYSEHDLPVLKPYIVSAQSLHNIEYENGEVSSLMYVLNEFEDEDDWATGVRYVFVNKDVTAILTRTVQPGRSIENYEFDDELVDISPDDGVIVQGERKRYKVVVSVRNLPAVPILPLGFVKLDSEPMFYGNEFCAVTELLERYARYDSEIVCIIDKYIKPEEIRLVEKPKPSLQAYSENDWEGGLKERSSLQGTEIEVDNLEDALEKGYLAHFDKMVIHLTPEFETLNKLIEQRASVKREIERTILGVEIFDRQQSGLTATEKRLELQAKENVASRRLRKQEEIINFLFYASASIYKASLVKGFVNRDLPELFFSFPKRLQVQTAGELLEEYKKTREMGAPQDVVRNILRKYRHVVFSGDLKRIHEEEVWDMLNPFRNILPEDWWAKYENMNQNVEGGPGLWNSWQFVLAQYEPAIRVMAEERFPAFYTNPVYLQFEQARKIVEEFMVGMLNIELDTLPKESTEKVEDDIEGEQVNEETTKTEDDVLDTVEANTEKYPQVYRLLKSLNWFTSESKAGIYSARSEADFIAVLINEGCKVTMHRDIITDNIPGLLSDVEPLLEYLESHLKMRNSIENISRTVGNDNTTNMLEFDLMNATVKTTDDLPLNEMEQAYVKAFLARSLELALDVEDYELASQIRDQAKFWGVEL